MFVVHVFIAEYLAGDGEDLKNTPNDVEIREFWCVEFERRTEKLKQREKDRLFALSKQNGNILKIEKNNERICVSDCTNELSCSVLETKTCKKRSLVQNKGEKNMYCRLELLKD